MENLHISNNSLVISSGKKLILRGVAIPDPYRISQEDDYDINQILKDIHGFGANVVRVTLKPSIWQAIPDYLTNYIDNVVDACEKLKLYCILDWHAIGNPIKNETRLKKEYFFNKENKIFFDYEVDLALAKNAWESISKRYGNKKHVLFEIFNEPAPNEKAIPRMELSALYWDDWKKEIIKLIEIIRKNSNNIIIVSPIGWAYNLSKVIENPLNEDNVLYSVHPYPIHKDWKENFEIAKNKIPLIVTEWGFEEGTSNILLQGTEEEYGIPIIEYMNHNSISWVAWCYDKIWGPRMLVKKTSWKDKNLTIWGQFVINRLKD